MKTERWYELNNWVEDTEEAIGLVFDRNRVIEECFSILVKRAAEEWENMDQCDLLENPALLKARIEEKKPQLLQPIRDTLSFVYWQVAKFFYNLRAHSLLNKDYRINDFLNAQHIDWILELEHDGSIKDISVDTSIARPPSNSLGSQIGTPEQIAQEREFFKRVKRLPMIIGAKGRKHDPEYEKILETELLDGIHVTPTSLDSLGIGMENAASRRHEAFKALIKILLDELPDLQETVKNLSKGKSHKIVKSTKKELVAQREKVEHGPIRQWTREGGYKIITYQEALTLKKRSSGRKKKTA